ncbi:N-acetyltransferase [Filobacillus milosensis]|uniref:N-acetyltransferase n=1 Tax=Filobacillus milosensis TaxID=94137 RepID=A0A4Y8ISG3_9BACI|nr:GNAT family N-acetyltransferase [Filobacillus milosensis]TFB23870.1 N-acetyltransferase [Filobacillus milosensis]
MNITLREINENDLPVFFEFQKDHDALQMAAFTAKEPDNWEQFMNHWNKILGDESIVKRAIIVEQEVVGNIICFKQFGEWEVTYWIDRKFWGKGIASNALRELLNIVSIRPLYGRTAKDNISSLRVLEKCGFQIIGEDTGYANARNKEIEEYIFKLTD